MLIFCRVHIQRNWRKSYPDAPDEKYILPLLNAPSKDAFKQQVQSLCEEYPNRKDWFKGKLANWMIAGLVASASKVPSKWRTYAAKSTNIAESGHWEDYVAVGQKQSLLAVILGLRRHIMDKSFKLSLFSDIGVSHTYHNRTDMARICQAATRKDTTHRMQHQRRETDPDLPYNPQNPYHTRDIASMDFLDMTEVSSLADIENVLSEEDHSLHSTVNNQGIEDASHMRSISSSPEFQFLYSRRISPSRLRPITQEECKEVMTYYYYYYLYITNIE